MFIRTEAVQGRDNSAVQRHVAQHVPWIHPACKTRPRYKTSTHLTGGSACAKPDTSDRRGSAATLGLWGARGNLGEIYCTQWKERERQRSQAGVLLGAQAPLPSRQGTGKPEIQMTGGSARPRLGTATAADALRPQQSARKGGSMVGSDRLNVPAIDNSSH
jgi:hypothetical protein